MGAVLLVFVAIAIGCLLGGLKLIGIALRKSAPPPIPPARTANPDPAERVQAGAARLARRAPGKLGRGVLVSLGVGLIAAPWIVVYTALRGLSDMNMTKGRVLRIRNRAQLPELAHGDGWSGESVQLQHVTSELERRVLGETWLLTARMEHASIAAFSQLALHLAALGAPSRLVEATHRAALDEIRHTRAAFAIARALTGAPHSAGPIGALATPSSQPIDLVRLAVGSLVDGCVGEGIAADVAARGSELAEDPAIRDTLAMIAGDEARHAELAWDVLAWCVADGGAAVERALRDRIEVLDREVAPRLPDIAGLADAALARHGVIGQDALGELARARIASVQDRARALVRGRDLANAA